MKIEFIDCPCGERHPLLNDEKGKIFFCKKKLNEAQNEKEGGKWYLLLKDQSVTEKKMEDRTRLRAS